MEIQMTKKMKQLSSARKICAVLSLAITVFCSIGFYNQSWNTAETFVDKILAFGLSLTFVVFLFGGFLPGFLHLDGLKKGLKGLCYIPILGLMLYIGIIYTAACIVGWAFLIVDLFYLISGKPAISKAEMKQMAEFDPEIMAPELSEEEIEADLQELKELELQMLREENRILKEKNKTTEKGSSKKYEPQIKQEVEFRRRYLEHLPFDENTDNLAEALKFLSYKIKELVQLAEKRKELKKEIIMFKNNTSHQEWRRVANLEQLKHLIMLVDIAAGGLKLAEQDKKMDDDLLASVKGQIVFLVNEFAKYNEHESVLAALFIVCMKHDDVMKYDYAMIDGHQLLYSTVFAFDNEKADEQDKLVIVALTRDGETRAFGHIDDVNEQLYGGEKYISKEKLKKCGGDIFEEMDTFGFDTSEDEGRFLFERMHDNLIKWHSARSKK